MSIDHLQVAGPIQPLTPRQEEVARELAKGYAPERIAIELSKRGRMIGARRVQDHIEEIAMLIPNPDKLRPSVLAMLWAAHRRWAEERSQAKVG